MAAPLSDDRLLAALRAEGCRVKEVRNWRTHGRPASTGGFGPINGVMIHHTVTSGTARTVDICYDGYSSLPGPLCHGVIGKDGVVYLISNGRANHAGGGDPAVLARVRAESYDRDSLLHPTRGNANGTGGNDNFYGFECENLGNGRDPWPEKQRDAMVRASAAILRAYGGHADGWTAKSVIGHKEWSNDKIDPRSGAGVDVEPPTLRKLIDERLAHPASWGSNSSEGNDDVPEYVSLTRPGNFTLEPGREDAIEFTREYADDRDDHYEPGGSQFIHGPALYQGTAYIQLTGVDVGADIQVRVSEVDRDSREYVGNGGRGEYQGTEGTTFIAYPFTDTTPKGEGVRLRIKHFSSQPVTVTHVMLKALVWPR